MEYTNGIIGEAKKGKIAVLIEEHFDQTEFFRFNEFFPSKGYQVEYLSHLWQQPELRFTANPDDGKIDAGVIVKTEISSVKAADYKGVLIIGAYATDRMRYQSNLVKGQPNMAPAVVFIREAMKIKGLKIGTICHALWLLCADNSLIKGRRVTCAHNIVCDVENAGGDVIFEGNQTVDLVVDGDLISGKHPQMVDEFMDVFLKEIES